MINKKNLWFLTLFSLILVLSVYYITMPSELLLTNTNVSNNDTKEKETVKVEESEVLTALRVKSDEELLKELDALKLILTDADAKTDDKNTAFEKMKSLNINKSEETKLETLIEDELQLKTFIKKNGDQIKVVVDSDKQDVEIANNIMRTIQKSYETKMYITVEFK